MSRASFHVRGSIRAADGTPAQGVIVQAFDKDFFRDQSLGSALTGADGSYDIRFDSSAFTGPLLRLERNPDIFLHVLDRKGNRLASTEQSIVVDAGKETRIDVDVAGALPPPVRFRTIDGQPVDLVSAAKLTASDIVDGYRYLRGRLRDFEKLATFREAFPGYFFLRRDVDDDCAEGHFRVLRRFAKERGSLELETANDADDFPATETVHTFFTDNILVKYTTDAGSPNAVNATTPAADTAVQLSDGTTIGFVRASLNDLHADNTEVAPTAVQEVGVIAEYALAQFLGPRINVRDPRNGATRFEYRILEQGGSFVGGTNTAWTHVEVDPGNDLLQNIHTVTHEMFHQVQYRYNVTNSVTELRSSILEGGARLIEDCINDVPNRWVDTARMLLNDPTLTLMDGYPAAAKAKYASGIFWKYLAEQHSTSTTAADEPVIGFDAYRKVLESMANVLPGDPALGNGIEAVRAARAQMPWWGSLDEFHWYSVAQNELSSNETTWGNFLVANYMHGLANPVADARFEYKEDEDAVTWSTWDPNDELHDFQAAVAVNNAISLTQGLDVTRNVATQNPFAATYFRLTASGGPRMLRVTFTADAGLTDPLVQILRLDGPVLFDLHRSDRTSWTKVGNVSGVTDVIVIVGTRTTAGGYSIRFEELASSSDVMATRWNSAGGTEYEANPQGWTWTWVSPDVMVDTNDDGLRDTDVFFGTNNKLKLRLRNRGNADANGVTVQFYYQKATGDLDPASWIPVTNAASVVQTAGPVNVPANSEQWVSVDWAPADDGTSDPHWCVKAVITAPGDPNTDNKVVMSNFNVVAQNDGDFLQLIRTSTETVLNKIHLIARGPNFVLVPKKWLGDPLESNKPAAVCACSVKQRSRDGAAFGSVAVVRRELAKWNGVAEVEPSASRYYPVDPRTLPPGTVAENLVTMAHFADGVAVGGVTYEIVPK